MFAKCLLQMLVNLLEYFIILILWLILRTILSSSKSKCKINCSAYIVYLLIDAFLITFEIFIMSYYKTALRKQCKVLQSSIISLKVFFFWIWEFRARMTIYQVEWIPCMHWPRFFSWVLYHMSCYKK